MGRQCIVSYNMLSASQKEEVVGVFIEGFGHMMTFTKDQEVLKALFLKALNPLYVWVCVEDEKVLGVLGIATNKVRPIKFDEALSKELLGKGKGKIVAKQMNGIFQSQVVKADTDLYIDFLVTHAQARSKGIGTTLLQYAFDLPRFENYYIEVVSKNKGAKKLYERMGFEIVKKSYFSFTVLMGLGYAIKMKKSR